MIQTKYLQDNLKNIQLLMNIPSLQNFEVRNLAGLIRLSRIRHYDAGEQIIKEGDQDPWIYFLLSGSVRVVKDDIELTRLKKMGEIFGELRIIDRGARSASIYAIEKSICLAVDTSAKNRIISHDEQADFILFLYKIFAEFSSARLRLTNEELIKAKKQLDQKNKQTNDD